MSRRKNDWAPTGFVSATCEVRMPRGGACGDPSVMAYPAMGGGYMALCAPHGERHAAYCVSIEDARLGKEPNAYRRRRSPIPDSRRDIA